MNRKALIHNRTLVSYLTSLICLFAVGCVSLSKNGEPIETRRFYAADNFFEQIVAYACERGANVVSLDEAMGYLLPEIIKCTANADRNLVKITMPTYGFAKLYPAYNMDGTPEFVPWRDRNKRIWVPANCDHPSNSSDPHNQQR